MWRENTTIKTDSFGNSGSTKPFPHLRKERRRKDNKIEIQMLWETRTTSTEYFGTLKSNIIVDLAIYAKKNDLLELEERKTLKGLTTRSKLTERFVKLAKLSSLRISPR